MEAWIVGVRTGGVLGLTRGSHASVPRCDERRRDVSAVQRAGRARAGVACRCGSVGKEMSEPASPGAGLMDVSFEKSGAGDALDLGILGFDHVEFWVGNAMQSATYFVARFGFEPYAETGLQTGSRKVMTRVLRRNNVLISFSSALEPHDELFREQLARSGDGVKSVAFSVRDCAHAFDAAVQRGAKPVQPVRTLKDENGVVKVAIIEAGYGGTWHTFVERHAFTGSFMPGFRAMNPHEEPLVKYGAPPPEFEVIDHCVCNVFEGDMEEAAEWYIRTLGFQRFWSVDDKQILTEYSAMRSVVVTDPTEKVKLPLNESAKGKRKSQIEEFLDYFGGPGIQHIAIRTGDIVNAVAALRKRGVDFISVPDTYYEDLRARLEQYGVSLRENLDDIQEQGLLVDFDERGYLLQIFTRPLQPRPTLFLEILQRRSHEGFGVNNFKTLFEAIERDQALRGNL
ncbi:4-hydroxyphenylpyruvate dioxygenase [Porphyridium purpureum]|uniref:4-hydroxyphenylpyruvate dioxygenase n=1 Tax=Porphyridium purpureum TaxID=35688 RepID=A0A5J4Z0C2_PORPP|nr:4-hydroxyphenylpyruvate dioxygenase [Porphyridium purpureum]|eukprot:POR7779..scf209_3